MISFAWLVENKGEPKKANNSKGELILGKKPSVFCLVLAQILGAGPVSADA